MNSKTYPQYVVIPALAFFFSAIISYNLTPERTPQHNSTIVGGSGELKPSAEVVDTYKECDIIRWSDNGLSEYKYFLYCPK